MRSTRGSTHCGTLQAAGITMVSLAQRLEGRGIPSIVHEEEEAGQRAAAYLLESGRDPVMFVGRITGSAIGPARYRGYAAALHQAGLTVLPALVRGIFYRFQAGYEAVTQALDAGMRFGAVRAGSDGIALGAIAALHDRGLRVPDDVAVMGFGDVDWGAQIRPSLTTLRGITGASRPGCVTSCAPPATRRASRSSRAA